MLIFIDESEDPSIKLGCSPLFTVVMVIFEDLEEVNRWDQRIDQQCFKLKLPKQFHFTKLCEDFLLVFLDAMVPCESFYLSDRYQQEKSLRHRF
jgi:hypothetical protein